MLDYYKNKEYISNSMLGWLDRSPAYFKHKLENQGEGTASMELGSMIHLALLEPDKFIVSQVDKPTGKMGAFIDAWLASDVEDLDGINQEAYEKSGYGYKIETVLDKFNKPEVQEYVQE